MGIDNENYETFPRFSLWHVFMTAFVVGMVIAGCM